MPIRLCRARLRSVTSIDLNSPPTAIASQLRKALRERSVRPPTPAAAVTAASKFFAPRSRLLTRTLQLQFERGCVCQPNAAAVAQANCHAGS